MRKSEYLPFIFMIAFLVLETTAVPAASYIDSLRLAHKNAEADLLQNGLIAFWFTFFTILIIGTLYNYFKSYERCVSMPRMNLVLTDRKGPEYFEGIGIIENRLYKTAAIDIAQYLEDKELIDVFNRFVKDRVSKYPGLQLTATDDKTKYFEKVIDFFAKRKQANKIDDAQDSKQILKLKPENLDERTINFHAYELEYFLINKYENYFNDTMRQWLEENEIKDKDDFLKLNGYELDSLAKKYKTEKNEQCDFQKIRSWMKDSFDRFDLEDLAFFQNKGFKSLGDLIESNLDKLEREFNQHIKKLKTGNKWKDKIEAFKQTLKIDYYPLKDELLKLKKRVVSFEKEFLIEFSKSKFENFLDVRLAKVRALYYQYFLEYVEIDEPIYFAVDRPTQDENKGKRKENEEGKEFHTYIPIKRFLMILPDSWGNTFHFRKKKILFEGYDISHPKVAEAEFVYHSLIVHNIALIYCNSSDYSRSSIQEDFHIDIDKFHEVVQAGLVNLIDELDAAADKLRVKIANRDKRIKAFKDGEDDKFEQWGADLDKSSNPIYEFKQPIKINMFMTFWMIMALVMGLVIGFFLGQGIPKL